MKKIIIIVALALNSVAAFGHADHAPRVAKCAAKECTKLEIESAAPMAIGMLSQSGKIESGWTSAKIEKIELKQFSKAHEWVVTLFDSKKSDKAKQRLYIFITTMGFLNGANSTGE